MRCRSIPTGDGVALHAAARVLTWRAGGRLPSALFAATVERLAAEFSAVLARLRRAEPVRGEALLQAARRCSQESLLRVLTAPATFARLAAGPAGDRELLRFAEESFCAELCRAGRSVTPPREVWTALGDFRFPSGRVAATGGSRVGTRREGRRTPPTFRAARVGGMPVDFCSPYAADDDVPVAGPAGDVKPEWAGGVLADIATALQGVGRMSGRALSVVRHFTRVIVVRPDPEHPGVFLSSSSPRYLGRSVLCNPDAASVEELAEALVHEAIHGLLCCVQMRRPFVLNHARLERLRVVSPWTGKVLPMDAYVEACFVWYGLAQLWTLGVDGTGFRPTQAEQLERRARSGFLKGPLVGALAPACGALTEEVMDVISTMQADVRASRGSLI